MTSARSCNNVGHLFWFTILAQHETNDVILYIHSVQCLHRGNTFQRQNYKMRLKQRSLNWINSMQVKKILFTNVFFPWSLCLLNMFPSIVFPKHLYFSGLLTHHSSWPFLECRPSKLYFKILWKYDDWSFRFHHFLENGRFHRKNTCKCSPLVTKWQIILHFHCCFNNKYTPYFLG